MIGRRSLLSTLLFGGLLSGSTTPAEQPPVASATTVAGNDRWIAARRAAATKLGHQGYDTYDHRDDARFRATFKAAPEWRVQQLARGAGKARMLREMSLQERFEHEVNRAMGKLP